MLNILRQNPVDVIFLIEATSFVGVCFEQIKTKIIGTIVQFFYSGSMHDDLGVSNDYSAVIFSAVTYKSLTSLPSSLCTLIQPTSHPRRFLNRLEALIDFRSGLNDDHTHLAEGLALAMDTFDEISNRRKHIQAARHLILIGCLNPYEDIQIIENSSYKGQLLDDIIQKYQQEQVNVSIVSPKYSPAFARIYESINQTKAQIRFETFDNISFFCFMHGSINFNPQQITSNEQMQQAKLQEEMSQFNSSMDTMGGPNSVQISSPFSNQASIIPPSHIQPSPAPSIPSPMMPQQQQQQQQQQPPNVYPILSPRQPPSTIQTITLQDETTSVYNQQQQSSQPPHIQQQMNVPSPQGQQQAQLMQRMPQQIIRQAIVRPQQQQQQQQQQFPPLIRQQQAVINPYSLPQQIPTQQQHQQRALLWTGTLEWQEKDRQNPANKIPHMARASAYTSFLINPQTGQSEPEVSTNQQWPQRLTLQIFSTHILTLPGAAFDANTKKVYFVVESMNDLKNALTAPHIGGGLVSLQNSDLKLLILQVLNGTELLGRVPQDPTQFIQTLKQFIARNAAKQQQQIKQQQMGVMPQQPQNWPQQYQPQPQQQQQPQPQQQQQYMDMYPQ